MKNLLKNLRCFTAIVVVFSLATALAMSPVGLLVYVSVAFELPAIVTGITLIPTTVMSVIIGGWAIITITDSETFDKLLGLR